MSLRNRCVDDDVCPFRALRAIKSSFLFPACLLPLPAIAIGKHASVPGKYWNSFSKGGKATAAELHQDDLGLLDPSGDSEGYLVQAASGAIEL